MRMLACELSVMMLERILFSTPGNLFILSIHDFFLTADSFT